jgi:hypothetical protein
LSSLSNKTILHNEKTFQNNWFYYSYPYYSGSSIFIFVSTPLPEGQQGAKAEALTDKIQAAINQTAWVLPPFLLALEEITIISGTKAT